MVKDFKIIIEIINIDCKDIIRTSDASLEYLSVDESGGLEEDNQ